MAVRKILVLGGTGFIGTHIVRLLGASTDYRVMVPTRRVERAKHLLVSPVVSVVSADIHDDGVLSALVAQADVVINLVGILHSRRARGGQPYGPDFEAQHVLLPRRVVAACQQHGAGLYLHMSALGADAHGPSMYQRSKAAGEVEVNAGAQAGLRTVIFRPSVVFGEGDRFLNLFASLQKRFPVLPLGSAEARFQPVYVGDVARAFKQAIDQQKLVGKTVELGGPRVYSLRELVRLAGWMVGRNRPILPLPSSAALLQAWLLEHLPGKLMSRDNVASMRVDNVLAAPMLAELQLTPTALEDAAPRYLAPRNEQRQFDLFRSKAGR